MTTTTVATATLAASGWDASDVITLAVAIVVPTVTVALTLWHQRRMIDLQHRQQRRWEAATVIGTVYGLMVDAHPDRLALNANRDFTPEIMRELRQRWASEIRPRLGAITASADSYDERELSAQLSVALHNMLHTGHLLAFGVLDSGPGAPPDIVALRDAAMADFDEGQRLIHALDDEVRRNTVVGVARKRRRTARPGAPQVQR